ncbi:hypothetical protein E2974_09790 [Paracoccus yeei]|uniref:hypothetical protein n=1 Tax=Paracoccus yeei TaxID=147645 RepID=UPI003BF78DF9
MTDDREFDSDELLMAWQSADWRTSSPVNHEVQLTSLISLITGHVGKAARALVKFLDIAQQSNHAEMAVRAKKEIESSHLEDLGVSARGATMRIVYSVELHRRKELNGILKGSADVHLVGPGLDTASAVAWRIAKDRAGGIAQGEWDTRFFIADEDGDRRIHVSRMFLTVTPGSRPIGVEVAFDADADAIAALAGQTADLLGCVDKMDSQGVLNVIQAGICDGDRLGARFDVR